MNKILHWRADSRNKPAQKRALFPICFTRGGEGKGAIGGVNRPGRVTRDPDQKIALDSRDRSHPDSAQAKSELSIIESIERKIQTIPSSRKRLQPFHGALRLRGGSVVLGHARLRGSLCGGAQTPRAKEGVMRLVLRLGRAAAAAPAASRLHRKHADVLPRRVVVAGRLPPQPA